MCENVRERAASTHLGRQQFAVFRRRQRRAHHRHARFVSLVQVTVPLASLRLFQVEAGRAVGLVQLEARVARAGVAAGVVRALVMATAVPHGALVDIDTLQPGAAHYLQLEAGLAFVTLYPEFHVARLDRHR